MFERFSDGARRAIVLAQDEARRLNHDYIGTEHILLGLLDDGESVAARALQTLGIIPETVREQVEEIIGRGKKVPSGNIPFTPRAKKVLELSLREAMHFHHDYIGPEHILLGLLREGEGVAVQALVRLGVDVKRARQQVVLLVAQEGEAGSAPQGEGEAEEGARLGRAEEGARRRTAVGREFWISEIQDALAKITDRLTAIERHLGMTGRPAEQDDPQAQEQGGSKAAEE